MVTQLEKDGKEVALVLSPFFKMLYKEQFEAMEEEIYNYNLKLGEVWPQVGGD